MYQRHTKKAAKGYFLPNASYEAMYQRLRKKAAKGYFT